LTGSPHGETNSTLVRVGTQPHTPFYYNQTGTSKLSQLHPPWPAKGELLNFNRTKNVWQMNTWDIRISQVVEIIPGKQPEVIEPGKWCWKMDTLIVAWQIENLSLIAHSVGLRAVVDTKVGQSDGVPVAFPGQPELQPSKAEFFGKDVPLFVQMQEFPDLLKPGTIAHMNFKVGGGLEAPERISVTRFDTNRPWYMPLIGQGDDGCVVLYWKDEVLPPGEKRWLGYSYGLGHIITDAKANPHLGLTVDGDFEVGKDFVVLAYIHQPKKGQTVKLLLEPSLSLSQGKEEQPVPVPNNSETALVSWTVRAAKAGQFKVTLQSGDQPGLQHKIHVAKAGAGKGMDKQKLFE
jgi:hypothetical protein